MAIKSELIAGGNMLAIQRYLRRINARLIRAIPRKVYDTGVEEDAYLVVYEDSSRAS